MPSKARKPQPKADLEPQPEPEALEATAEAAIEDDPTLEMEFEPEPEPEATEPRPSPGPTPSGMAEAGSETAPASKPDPVTIPVAENVIVNGLASFGPVIINGQATRCKKGVLYHVPDTAERLVILGTGRFRIANTEDLARAGQPSAGPGGAITRELLPPGAIKGGLVNP